MTLKRRQRLLRAELVMHTFGKYIATALITFVVGLACSFLMGRERSASRPSEEIHALLLNAERTNCSVTRGSARDEFESSYLECGYSDGTYLQQLTTNFKSPELANSALQSQIQRASQVFLRAPLFDESGRQIGERVVAIFPTQDASGLSSTQLLWTDGGTLVLQRRSAVKTIPDLDQER